MSAPYKKVFKLERDDDVLIITPQGDAQGFRYNDVHQESNATLQLLDDTSLRHVIIDFGSGHVLGSIMISVVIKICRKVGTRGGKAAFCDANPDMLEVLRTMNLERLWPYCPTREDALTSLRAG
jgi:anti-anti-sigma regulatory factor